jgi:hypothetical protein
MLGGFRLGVTFSLFKCDRLFASRDLLEMERPRGGSQIFFSRRSAKVRMTRSAVLRQGFSWVSTSGEPGQICGQTR